MRFNQAFNTLQNLIRAEINQAELGRVLGVSRANINYKKQANVLLSEEDVKKIETYYNVSLTSNETKSQNYTDIPIRGNVTASMGYGLTVYDENKTGTYAINNKLAKDLGINLKQSEIIFAKGDSMMPTIEGGDSLLVDLTKKEIHDGAIYCVRIDGEVYAKRLQKLPPNKVKVISDNKEKYDPFYIDLSAELNFDFEVIGEVRWWGRVAK